MTRRGAYKVTRSKQTLSSFGGRVKAIRQAWGWTQLELATILHVPQSAVSAWEADKTKPIGPVLAHLLQLFGISGESLIEGNGFIIPSPEGVPPGRCLVIAESESMRPVVLPGASAGEVWRIEPDGEEPVVLSLKEATCYLQKIVKEGGAAWIVTRRSPKTRGHV